MNATIKTATHRQTLPFSLSLPLPNFKYLSLSKFKGLYLLISLMVLVCLSGLAVVYIQNENYQLVSKQQKLLIKQNQLNNHWTMLLQMQGTLDNQSNVNKVAQQLNMTLPNSKNVTMVKTQ